MEDFLEKEKVLKISFSKYIYIYEINVVKH